MSSIDPNSNSDQRDYDLRARVAEPSWYQTLYEHLPSICFTLDSAGVVIAVNQFATARLGYTAGDLIKKPIFSILHPEDQPLLQELIRNYSQQLNQYAGGLAGSKAHTVYEGEARILASSGCWLWVKAIANALPEEVREKSTVWHPQSTVILLVCFDITEHKQIEQQQRENEKRRRLHARALVELAKSHTHNSGDLNAALAEITKTAAGALEVERVSVWLYQEEHSHIICQDLYERSAIRHSEGMVLMAANYPTYFQALSEQATIAAHNARTDPRTQEFSESYLSVLGITAMLDVPVWLNGQMVGFVCYEHVGSDPSGGESGRQWTPDEEEFAATSADFVARAMEECERLRTLKVLIYPQTELPILESEVRFAERRERQQVLLSQYYKQLEEEVEERTAELRKANEQLQAEISKRVQTEAALRGQQEEQQIIFDSLPAMIWHKDRKNRLLRVNKAAAEFSGLPPSELEGKYLDEISPSKSEEYYKDDLEVINSGSPKFGIIEQVSTGSGEKRWIRIDKVPYRDAAGNIEGAIGFGVDITERIRVEEELRQYRDRALGLVAERMDQIGANEQLQKTLGDRLAAESALKRDRNLFIGGPVTVFRWLAKENWLVEYVSQNVTQFGYQVSDFTTGKMHYASIIHPADLSKVAGEVKAYSEAGVRSFEQDYRIQRGDGEIRWIYDFRVVVRNEAGEITHYEGYILDISERKFMESELSRTRSLLRATLESTGDGIIAIGSEGNIVSYNQKFVEMWGIPDEIVASPSRARRVAFLAQQLKEPEAFLRRVRELYDQPDAVGYDILELKDGRIIERHSQPQRVGEKIIGRVWNFRDITAAKQAEATLRESEKRFRAIFDSSVQFAVLLNPNGTLLEANQKALELGGLQRSDVVGRLFWECGWLAAVDVRDETDRLSGSCLDNTLGTSEIKSAATLSPTQERLREAIASAALGQFVRHEENIKGAHSEQVPIEFSIKPVKDENLQVVLLIVEGRDISESKQAEALLGESEERYRSVITAMAEGVVLQDALGVICACNAAAERILGLTADQIMGKTSVDPDWRTIHEDGSPFPGETHPISVTLRTGKPCKNVVQGIHKPDGTITWISVNSQPLFHPSETKPYAAVASFTDITERKQAEMALQQQAERERLIGAIAQRIRQSLNLQETLHTTVAEVRQLLQADRAIVFRLESQGKGVVAVESVNSGWTPILGTNIHDPCFWESCVEFYRQGNIRAIEDIYTAALGECHLNLLAQFEVRANLVVPILQNKQTIQDHLWGLLIVHECRGPRQWQLWEGELLKQLTAQVAIAIQQAQLYQQLQVANLELHSLATSDALTRVANRRRFDEYLEQEWSRCAGEPISLILCDIDCFKAYNDTYGHPGGDACLQLVAGAISRAVRRPVDLVARYGGEEFAVILPNTDTASAVRIAEEIRVRVRALGIAHASSPEWGVVTLSLGVASAVPDRDTSPSELIAAADGALYQAKAAGRDRVAVANSQPATDSQ